MASEPRRPPTRTRNGSGSRPPTSRFQEGSMNDRTSAVPPPQFLGPEELTDYESQFYAERVSLNEARAQRYGRPSTAAAQLQAMTTFLHLDDQEHQPEHHRVTHKKSISFFGRVRDVLFHNKGGPIDKPQDQMEEPAELHRQETNVEDHVPEPEPTSPRPEYMHAAWAQSEINITQIAAQMRPGPRRAVDRPSREEVEASYYQLMASGFFKSHAIQSTRHAPPRGMEKPQEAPTGAMPLDHHILSSITAPARTSSSSLINPSITASSSQLSQENPPAKPATRKTARSSVSSLYSLFTPSIPDLRKKDSRYTLRGRKRTRADGVNGTGAVAASEVASRTSDVTPRTSTTDSNYSFTNSTAYLAQPLKKVAKKLRKASSKSRGSTDQQQQQQQQPQPFRHDVSIHQKPPATADGILRLAPTLSAGGGSLFQTERSVRLRSPSPKSLHERTSDKYSEKAVFDQQQRPKRKTFSYKLKEPLRSREKTRQQEQPQQQQQQTKKRDTSCDSQASRASRTSRISVFAMRHRHGTSVEETIIHCDFGTRAVARREWEWECETASIKTTTAARTTTTTTTTTTATTTRARRSDSAGTLQMMTDATNRGVPSVPKVPERWHGSGKAYHLKDRGSRDLERYHQYQLQQEREREREREIAHDVDDEVAVAAAAVVANNNKRSSWCGKENGQQQQHARATSWDQQNWHIGNAF